MENEGMTLGVLIGVGLMWGIQAWQGEPVAIENMKSQMENAYVLQKFGSGQVAVFHGFADDYEVCFGVSKYLEAQGGFYGCHPAISVSEIPQP